MPESSKDRKAGMRQNYHHDFGRRRKRAKTGQKRVASTGPTITYVMVMENCKPRMERRG